ncbi:hypothetical protein EN978_07180 [Mesorhizobium sp. M7A.F.Ca.US.001.04.1.1]|uniref:hypothetical protein n=1 Tax=Mesorhizobium sp. M7A.F.Ca.US.001.04.1.1 TaxID=2496726 RepID=UPI000FCBF2B3|nr:hypothetical protein [Mesorhizobium sp. M7A.F.Ca.US.001.04.1.1]RUY44108.1 hypothetical protein EN978_07180 [Mesorhizobium sp. M7A.F.Ca.US.001.04.1.1]
MKAIAAALDLSVAEAVSHMIREKIAAGVIPDAIPGILIHRTDNGVHIQIDDDKPATVAVSTARQIAEALRSVANGGGGVVELSPFDASKSFSVVRQGTGIKLQVPFHGPTAHHWNDAPSFSADLARDLAGLIERAAE